MTRVSCDMMNPFAVGHLVNHPPPDTAANIKFIDFDLPYIDNREAVVKRNTQAQTRKDDVMRAVAMVSQ